MAYDFSHLHKKVDSAVEWLKKEYFVIRTGKAMPQVLDALRVDSYGSSVPINQVASVSTEDARTLRIVPYDPANSKALEKAIVSSDLGLSVSSDDRGVRVFFPELTSENRAALAKVLKNKCEQAHVSLRAERDAVWSDIQSEEKKGEIGEDEKFLYKEEMEKIIGRGNNIIDGLFEKKEQEILNA